MVHWWRRIQKKDKEICVFCRTKYENANTKRKSNNENIQANNNFEIYPNKDNLNRAEKSKIKNLPKFQLNFNKINNLNKSEEENKNLSNNTAKIKFKKINVKISTHGKTNRDSSRKKKSMLFIRLWD